MPDKTLGEESRYAYTFGLVKHLETKLMARDKFEKMLDARNTDEMIKIMAETAYGPFSDEKHGTASIEETLAAELRRTHKSLLPEVPDKGVLNLFFIEYDIHNLKVLLKSRLTCGSTGDADAFVDAGTMERKKFVDLLSSNTDAISEAFPDYAADIKKAASMYGENGDISVVDSVLDIAMYRRMAELAAGNQLLESIITMQTDVGNMKLVARAKNLGRKREDVMFLPGGTIAESELLSLYEKGGSDVFAPFIHKYGKIVTPALDEFREKGTWSGLEKHAAAAMMETVRRSSHAMGAEALAGYVLAKKLEISTIRMIFVSKLMGTPAERVRGMWSI